jgi:hypothetical protein
MKPSLKKNKYLYDTAAALAAVLLCMAAVVLFWNVFAGNRENIAYPLTGSVANYDPYVQQFDSLMKGLTWIDYQPDPALDTLDNVYDYAERTASGIFYLWDRAYYNGHFYSYFGLAPVLTVYMPFYLITGSLPGSGFVMAFLCLIAAVFIPLTVFEWARIFAPETPAPVLAVSAVAVFWGSLILLIARGHTPFYFVACASANAWLSAFLWFCLRAYGADKPAARCALYAAAGVCYGLLFQSRVNLALMAAFLVVPGLWFFIIGRDRGCDRKSAIRPVLCELCSLGVPVFMFFCGSMIFNAVRFSGPLDFGNAYQLTISDIGKYRLRLSDLPFAIYHYFVDPPARSDVYPYISFSYLRMSDYGHYLYRDAGLGLFSVPMALTLLTSPAVIFSPRFRKSLRVMTACAVAGLVSVSLIDFCLGGVIYRYTSDLTMTAALFSAVILISYTSLLRPAGEEADGAAETAEAGDSAETADAAEAGGTEKAASGEAAAVEASETVEAGGTEEAASEEAAPETSTGADRGSAGEAGGARALRARRAKKLLYIAACVCLCGFLAYSVAVCIRICLINGNGNVVKYSEEISAAVEKLLPFRPRG